MSAPYYSDDSVTLYHGDCREVLPALTPVETCITDPPYGLSFMGKGWDHGVPGVEFWQAVVGALLPGAPVLAFGGTRTFHRLTCAIEDAGFEVRDCLMWLYGSGFPKSLDISKAIDKTAGAERESGPARWPGRDPNGTTLGRMKPATDAARQWNGWGTALKPAWEPVVLAMKPLDGTFAENALQHGVAGLNIDGARIEGAKAGGSGQPPLQFGGTNARPFHKDAAPREFDRSAGRWPANLVLDEEAAALLDAQSGELTSGARDGQPRRNRIFKGEATIPGGYCAADSGGASRFFYTSKASRSERGHGNTHPTVKPLDLLEYLCTLTRTPAGGTVLDPFCGSGSTLIAAMRQGRKAIGIELQEEYCEIAVRRIREEPLSLPLGEAS